MSRRPLLATTAVLTLLTLAACGGDDSSPTASEDSGDDAATTDDPGESTDDYGLVTPGVLTVATEGTYRPFTYHDEGSGDLIGFDVEIIEAVAEKLDLEIVFQETQWDAIFAGLDAGRFDLIANQVSINPQREEQYLFSEPYTVSPGVIVTREDDTSITGFDDLDGATTAQSRTSNWYELATEHGANVEAVEGWAQAVTLLEQGRVDATINDRLTYLDYENTNGPTGLRIAAETDDPAYNAFALTQDKTALVEAIDGALAELRDEGVLAEISDTYFGADVTQ